MAIFITSQWSPADLQLARRPKSSLDTLNMKQRFPAPTQQRSLSGAVSRPKSHAYAQRSEYERSRAERSRDGAHSPLRPPTRSRKGAGTRAESKRGRSGGVESRQHSRQEERDLDDASQLPRAQTSIGVNNRPESRALEEVAHERLRELPRPTTVVGAPRPHEHPRERAQSSLGGQVDRAPLPDKGVSALSNAWPPQQRRSNLFKSVLKDETTLVRVDGQGKIANPTGRWRSPVSFITRCGMVRLRYMGEHDSDPSIDAFLAMRNWRRQTKWVRCVLVHLLFILAPLFVHPFSSIQAVEKIEGAWLGKESRERMHTWRRLRLAGKERSLADPFSVWRIESRAGGHYRHRIKRLAFREWSEYISLESEWAAKFGKRMQRGMERLGLKKMWEVGLVRDVNSSREEAPLVELMKAVAARELPRKELSLRFRAWRSLNSRLNGIRAHAHSSIRGAIEKGKWEEVRSLIEFWRRYARRKKEHREGRRTPRFEVPLNSWDEYAMEKRVARHMESKAERFRSRWRLASSLQAWRATHEGRGDSVSSDPN